MLKLSITCRPHPCIALHLLQKLIKKLPFKQQLISDPSLRHFNEALILRLHCGRLINIISRQRNLIIITLLIHHLRKPLPQKRLRTIRPF